MERKNKESLAKPREEVVQFIKNLITGERRTIYTPNEPSFNGRQSEKTQLFTKNKYIIKKLKARDRFIL